MEKNKRIAVLTIITIVVVTVFGIIVFKLQNKNNDDVRNYDSLEVISAHDEYVLAVDKKGSDLDTYAVFEATEYYEDEKLFVLYKKMFSLENIVQTMESRFVCWTDKNLYFFGNNPTSYNLENGDIEAEISLLSLFNGNTGRLDKILGVDSEYIYYEYSHNSDDYFGKININLTEVYVISEESIPKDLN